MKTRHLAYAFCLLSGLLLLAMPAMAPSALAQEQTTAADTQADDAVPPPLDAADMDILVARIALYPDDLVALITAASLYPDQIAEAEKFLAQSAGNESAKPDPKWDPSVISLLNYPEIVKMMNGDPDWTEELGTAVTYQEADVLAAVQRLRDKAMDEGVLKSDNKMKVAREDDSIVITPASDEHVYVPNYAPQMLYEPGYARAPIGYYPHPYPYYYDPTARFFAAAVTGVVWGVTLDWHRHGLWGGRWGRNFHFTINCRHCYRGRNINGPLNWRSIDWRRIDRRRISFNRRTFHAYHQKHFARTLEANRRNNLHYRAVKARKLQRMHKLQQQRKSGIMQQGQKTKLRTKTQQQKMQMQKKNKLQTQKQILQKKNSKKYKLKKNKNKQFKKKQQHQQMRLQKQRSETKQFRQQRSKTKQFKLQRNKKTQQKRRKKKNQQ